MAICKESPCTCKKSILMPILPDVLENINLVLSIQRIFMAKKSWGDLALYPLPKYLPLRGQSAT